jgi:hypothetical protein
MRGFDILVGETRSRTIYDLESEARDRASHSHAGSPKPAPRQASRWTAWGLAWTPPHPVLVQAPIGVGGGARLARWRAGGPAANDVRLAASAPARAGSRPLTPGPTRWPPPARNRRSLGPVYENPSWIRAHAWLTCS